MSSLNCNPANWPPWAEMWLLAAAVYFACKWLTWSMAGVPVAPWWKHAGYVAVWPGLDARAFLSGSQVSPVAPLEWSAAAFKLIFGLAILFIAIRRIPAGNSNVIAWTGMIGIVLALHFGLFHLLSCFWRTCGVVAKPLMHQPLAATSIREFWGQRWNTAFRDLTHRFIFRPLAAKAGTPLAITAGFAFSGLIHELVISVPAGGGYGGPTLYFLIQCAAFIAERSKLGRVIGLGRGWCGWLFTFLVVLLPAPLLFHPHFTQRVVLPFLRAIGAMS